MLKAKLPMIILLVLLVLTGFISFTFYSQVQTLTNQNIELTQEKKELNELVQSVRSKLNRAQSDNRDLGKKNKDLQKQMTILESKNRDLQKRYNDVSKERESLVEKIRELSQTQVKQVAEAPEVPSRPRYTPMDASASDHWADVIQDRAELQAKMENMYKELIDARQMSAELEKENKELSIKIDELTKEKERFDMEITFKERTMEIMGRDLVGEREARRRISAELQKLRDENVGLKRELILANKEKINIQEKLKESIKKRQQLEKTVSQVENVLKEKSMIFSELETRLTKAVTGGGAQVTENSASVELPPIVVKSDASVSSLRGEVLAVNKNENFVIIDLGEDAGVKPTINFNVLRGETVIGTIEVIETRREISAADIKEMYSSYAIREGDTVIVK